MCIRDRFSTYRGGRRAERGKMVERRGAASLNWQRRPSALPPQRGGVFWRARYGKSRSATSATRPAEWRVAAAPKGRPPAAAAANQRRAFFGTGPPISLTQRSARHRHLAEASLAAAPSPTTPVAWWWRTRRRRRRRRNRGYARHSPVSPPSVQRRDSRPQRSNRQPATLDAAALSRSSTPLNNRARRRISRPFLDATFFFDHRVALA